jgi:hypothetical protein
MKSKDKLIFDFFIGLILGWLILIIFWKLVGLI